ncbi:polymorphic toxin-type HINT domain-containing protein [Streptomyces spororaveus]|uniref:polymorphic toxin-type HINT domain-containing protein n=1 Tax=Streptomyces spororaveus TaxID=284039 RepID=UPI0037B2E43A
MAEITPGDEVEAADPETGEASGGRSVVATWAHDDSDLIDLVVEVAPGDQQTLHTTAEHPFWDETTRTWVPAAELPPGHALTTPDAREIRVLDVRPTPGTATRYNLTVAQLHTYYVVAGGVPVLVHNTCDANGHETDPALKATSDWTPDPDYSPAEIASRGKVNSEFYSIPKKTHDLVDKFRANPNMPPRPGNGPNGVDVFRGDDLSGKAERFWGPWRDSKIYWNEEPGSQIRIMVREATQEIAWFPLNSRGVHIYESPGLYKW